jgi:glyoxylase-like metal-dependent hydrolase (beta-lactamase superfamily II)
MPPTRCSIACRRDGTRRAYRIPPAPPGRELDHNDVVDLGDRSFEVVHTPGHSPGGIGLFERATGIFLSGDVIYDGPLIDDAYHSNRDAYLATMEMLRALPVSVVHGGHFPSFGPTRFSRDHRRVLRRPAEARLPPVMTRADSCLPCRLQAVR